VRAPRWRSWWLGHQWIFVYFNSSRPVELAHGTHDSSGAALSLEARAGAQGHMTVPKLPRGLVARARAMRHVVALELPWIRRWESGPRGTWRLQSSPEPGGESRNHGTHGHTHSSCLSSWLRAYTRDTCYSGYRQHHQTYIIYILLGAESKISFSQIASKRDTWCLMRNDLLIKDSHISNVHSYLLSTGTHRHIVEGN
jgi:hypothetical protein